MSSVLSRLCRSHRPKKLVSEEYFCSNFFLIRIRLPLLHLFSDYELVSGLRRKVKEFSAEDAGTEKLDEEEERQKLREGTQSYDPMYMLEHKGEDKKRAKKLQQGLQGLVAQRDSRYEGDYDANR